MSDTDLSGLQKTARSLILALRSGLEQLEESEQVKELHSSVWLPYYLEGTTDSESCRRVDGHGRAYTQIYKRSWENFRYGTKTVVCTLRCSFLLCGCSLGFCRTLTMLENCCSIPFGFIPNEAWRCFLDLLS
jgi:hypothetical protein